MTSRVGCVLSRNNGAVEKHVTEGVLVYLVRMTTVSHLTQAVACFPRNPAVPVRFFDLIDLLDFNPLRFNRLDVPFVRLSTVGGRAFNVAGPRIWNSLPDHVTSDGTLTTFRHRLKTFFVSAILFTVAVLAVAYYLGHFKNF